jgi:putative sterol carrier protein
MPAAFLPETAQDVRAVVQYHLAGDGGGDWVVTISDGTCTVEQGSAADPRLTITAAANDYVDMAIGKLDPMAAFAAGKVKVQGDIPLALRMMGFFRQS